MTDAWKSFKERQMVDLAAAPQAHVEAVTYRGNREEVRFNEEALAKIKDYLVKRGITPDNFPWPPQGKPDAEPFPGLSAFTEDDAAIFFGRDADILTGLDEFRLLRRRESPRFLAIQAASGAGKSSYLRAGLWPRLSRDPDCAPLAILRPLQGILTGPEGLGQKLAAKLSRPGAPVNPGDIYTRLIADDLSKAAADFARFMKTAAEQAHDQRRVGDPGAPPPALVIAIDQAEELLAPENAAESQRLLVLVAALMRDLPAGVEPFGLLTVRADSATRLYQAIAEQNLEVPKTLTLLPLPRTSYRDVIVKPIEVAARHGKRISIQASLTERLVADATGADALPLLAFTLFQLYKGFSAGDKLTLEQYQAIGGVASSIKEGIKQALASPASAPVIPTGPREQLDCLRAAFIPWLARIDPVGGEPTRRIADLNEFTGYSRAMVERLIERRLLVADRRGGNVVVEVAHESLLRQWPPLTAWLQEDADDLRVADAVELAADEWVRNGRHSAWLDHRADRLAAAERVVKRADFRQRLGEDRIAYIKACRAREALQRRIRLAALWSTAAVLVLAVLVLYEWRDTVRAREESEASLLIAQSGAYLSNLNVGPAIERAKRAFQSVPSAASRSALLRAVMELSPHLIAVVPLGNDSSGPLAWASSDMLDFTTEPGRLRLFDSTNTAQSPRGFDLPVIKRSQDGNPSFIRALSPIGAAGMLVIFDEGSVGVIPPGGKALRLNPPQQQVTVNPIQHAVAIGPTGAVIALATGDEIILYRCDWSVPARSGSACASAPLGDAHGHVVAISPDEKRIAVGDEAGAVRLYDLTGKVIGGPKSFEGPINALGWASQRDLLAVATTRGEIAVLDVGAAQTPIVAQQKFGTDPITALAWSPGELGLAFVCNSKAVCLWRAKRDADPSRPFKPAERFEGHTLGITRLSFAPNGSRMASGATDGTIRVWSLTQDTDATYALYAEDPWKITTVAVSPDHQWVAGGSSDGAVGLWDARSGAASRVVRPAENFEVKDLAWNRKGAVAALNDNDTVAVIRAAPDQPMIEVPIKIHTGYHLDWVDEDRTIAVAMIENGVFLVNAQSPAGEPVPIGDGRGKDEAWGVASIPGAGSLLVSYIGGEIKI